MPPYLSRHRSRLLALLRWQSPRSLWHRAFHRDHERWALTQFKDADASFYLSRHQVTCARCGINQTVHQSWPKFNADRNQGFLLAEAHRRASRFTGQEQP